MNADPAHPLISTRMKATLYALVLLAVAALACDRGPTSLVIAVVASAAAWLLVEGPRRRPLPRPVINAAVLVASVILWYRIVTSLGDQSVIKELSYFIVAITLCKLFERKTRRDFAQIMVLTMMIIIAATMLSSSGLAFTSVLLAYLVVMIYAAILMNVGLESWMVAADQRSAAILPGNGQWASFRRDLRHLTKRCLFIGLPVATLIFLVIPRTRAPGFINTWVAGAMQTGFTETVQFPLEGQLTQSDVIAFQVSLTQDGDPVGSELTQPYFRGVVLEDYNAEAQPREWVRRRRSVVAGAADPAPVPLAKDWPVLLEPPLFFTEGYFAADLIFQKYRLINTVRSTLFTLAPAVSIDSDDFTSVRYDRYDLTAHYNAPNYRPMRYSVASPSSISPQALVPPEPLKPGLLRPAITLRTQVLPEVMVDPRITELAREVAEEYLPAPGAPMTTDQLFAITSRIERYLSATYPYSLTFSQVDRDLDPTVDFLFNRKDTGGPCYYFASAMVMMCRSLGIHARVVSGYRGGDYNSIGQYYVVREKHAHAWAEFWVPEMGWVLSDPSPDRLRAIEPPGILRRLFTELAQVVQSLWLAGVVSFDDNSRMAIFSWLYEYFAAATRFLASWGGVLWDGIAGQSVDVWMGRSLAVTLIGLTAFLASRFLRRWMYLRRLRVAHPGLLPRRPIPDPGRAAFLDELMRLLARHAKERRPDQTPREYIDEFAPRLGDALVDARFLVEAAYGLCFGGVHLTHENRERLASCMRRVKNHLRNEATLPHSPRS